MTATIFPLPSPDGVFSLRFYAAGTATANYTDNQWKFTLPLDSTKQAWCKGLRITAAGADLTLSFDGVNTHGVVKSGATADYVDRCEAGICVKGSGTFTIEAW